MPGLLIGVDGGASEVKAHQILRLDGGLYGLGPHAAALAHAEARPPGLDFTPGALARQLEEARQGHYEISDLERAEGRRWVESAASAIERVAQAADATEVLLGVCMPGLKSADRRGLVVVAHGPRIPRFADELEFELGRRGLTLARPIARLESDGDCCGWGEELGATGLFRGLRHAYYLGGGTGCPEALKLDGRLVGFDDLAGRLPKAWQLEAQPGITFESLLAPAGINRRYRAERARRGESGEAPLPEEAAARGDELARGVLCEAGQALAALVYARAAALAHGLGESARPAVLESVVIGQRLGELWEHAGARPWLRERAEEHLAEIVRELGEPQWRERWLAGGALRPDFLRASRLRAAPAIGAAARACAAAENRA